MGSPKDLLAESDSRLAREVKRLADGTMGAGGRDVDKQAGRELVALVKAAERAGDGRVLATLATKDLRDIILFAAEHGHLALVEGLLGAGVSPSYAVLAGLRPIVTAAQGGHADVIAALVRAGEDPNYAGFFKTPVLLHAAHANRWGAVRALVELGADVRARAALGGTTVLIEAAAAAGAWVDAELVRLIVERRGADVNDADDEGRTPLMAAAAAGDVAVVRELIRLGADVNAARRWRRLEVIDRENRGVDMYNDRSWRKRHAAATDPLQTALMFAALEGHAGVVEALLAAGADAAARDENGRTAADYANEHGHATVCRALQGGPVGGAARAVGVRDLLGAAEAGDLTGVRRALDAGVDVDGRVPARYDGNVDDGYRVTGGRPALVIAAGRGDVKLVTELLKRGADVEARGDATLFDNGQSPLHAAAERGHVEVVRVLIAAGARLHAREQGRKDVPGRTAMQLAVENKRRAVADELLRAGAAKGKAKRAKSKPAKATSKRTPAVTGLHEAAEAGNGSLVNRLVAAGADVNKLSVGVRWSPLMHACFMGRWSVAEVLLGAGADVNLRNRLGQSALDVAVHGGTMAPDVRPSQKPGRDYAKTVRVLLARGAEAHAVSRWDAQTPLDRAGQAGLRSIVSILKRAAAARR